MITWFWIAIVVVSLVSAVVCLVEGLRKRGPNDYTMGATLLVALLLLAQIIVAIVQPLVGNPSVGDPLEFWLYLIVAFALPIGAGIWALVDKTYWANIVLAVVGVSVAVMIYRMSVIWG